MCSENGRGGTNSGHNERKLFKMVQQHRVKTWNWASIMKWLDPSWRWQKDMI